MKTFVFIDASNLFYGGEKSLGWKIDYQKLLTYLQTKYSAEKTYYFGGVETHAFPYDPVRDDDIPIERIERFIIDQMSEQSDSLDEATIILMNRHLKRIRFYLKLKTFGYMLCLKQVKRYDNEDGSVSRKANCDVDLTLVLMKAINNFDRAIILSGDGDFLSVLKYLKAQGKEVVVLARAPRTAREIKRFAGSNFRDFTRLRSTLEFVENKTGGHAKYPPRV